VVNEIFQLIRKYKITPTDVKRAKEEYLTKLLIEEDEIMNSTRRVTKDNLFHLPYTSTEDLVKQAAKTSLDDLLAMQAHIAQSNYSLISI
jgi:predicted Zn-dependent peptidase